MSTLRQQRHGIGHWLQAVAGACLGTCASVFSNALHNAAYFGVTCAGIMLLSQFAQNARAMVSNSALTVGFFVDR